MKYAEAVADHLLGGLLEQAADIAAIAHQLFTATKPEANQLVFNWESAYQYKGCTAHPLDYLKTGITPQFVCSHECKDCSECECNHRECLQHQVISHYTVWVMKNSAFQYPYSAEWGIGWHSAIDEAGPFETLDMAKEYAKRFCEELLAEM
jgi:hypothetical protein